MKALCAICRRQTDRSVRFDWQEAVDVASWPYALCVLGSISDQSHHK